MRCAVTVPQQFDGLPGEVEYEVDLSDQVNQLQTS